MNDTVKKIPAQFFKTELGTEPVHDWLKSLDREERTIIGADIKTVEYGFPIGMPTCKPLGDGLYEVRSNLPSRIARVIFCIHDSNMILLHGFIKKEQKISTSDLELAKRRKRQLESG